VNPHIVTGLIVITAFCGHSQEISAPLNLKSGMLVQCAYAFTARGCRNSQVSVQLAIEKIQPALRDWRFVIVPDNRWA
jgi:hypothetical protein